jgi:IS6 family transposase
MTVGGWTKPTYVSRASGVTCIVRWIPPAPPSTSFSGAKQDAAAAKRFLAKALGRQNHPVPRVINTDGHSAYPPAIAQLKSEGTLDSGCQHRPVPYLNNVLEQDHRAIKRRVNASQGFRSFGLPGARWPAMR